MWNKIKEIYNNKQEFKYWNLLITIAWFMLYLMGWLTLVRIQYFIKIIYKMMWKSIDFLVKIKINNFWLNVMMKISTSQNLVLHLIANLEVLLLKWAEAIKNQKIFNTKYFTSVNTIKMILLLYISNYL